MTFKLRTRSWEVILTFGGNSFATRLELTRDTFARYTTQLKRSSNSTTWPITDNVSVRRLTTRFWPLKRSMKKTRTLSKSESLIFRENSRSVTITSLIRPVLKVLERKPMFQIKWSSQIQLRYWSLDLTVGLPTTRKSAHWWRCTRETCRLLKTLSSRSKKPQASAV